LLIKKRLPFGSLFVTYRINRTLPSGDYTIGPWFSAASQHAVCVS
jgi:hypothetical protein